MVSNATPQLTDIVYSFCMGLSQQFLCDAVFFLLAHSISDDGSVSSVDSEDDDDEEDDDTKREIPTCKSCWRDKTLYECRHRVITMLEKEQMLHTGRHPDGTQLYHHPERWCCGQNPHNEPHHRCPIDWLETLEALRNKDRRYKELIHSDLMPDEEVVVGGELEPDT